MGEFDTPENVQQLRSLVTTKLEASPDLKSWCTEACLKRYLRARKGDVRKAEKMLLGTMQWRETYQPHKISWAEVKEEGRTGKTFVYSHPDLRGRPIVVMRPRNQNTKNADMQIKFLVYCLEAICKRADTTDFEGYSMSNAPPPKVGIQTLNILQNHYPERLALAICYHPPWLFQIMWKAVGPFIDPVTKGKIHFCEKGKKGDEQMAQFFNMDRMEDCMGGKVGGGFNFADYEKAQLEYEQSREDSVPVTNGAKT